MQKLEVIEYDGIRVLTSKQLAKCYGTGTDTISYNYRYNKKRYRENKHYIVLKGQELREFKLTNVEIQRSSPRVNILYLWTEKGALLHAKSLNTDKAWEVYDYLVDFYFRAKETPEAKKHILPVPQQQGQKLAESDEHVLAYNRGVVMGVLRSELEEDSTLEIYERLSARGKGLVMKMLFGEVVHG